MVTEIIPISDNQKTVDAHTLTIRGLVEMVALGEKEMGVIAEKDLSDCQQKMRQLSERVSL